MPTSTQNKPKATVVEAPPAPKCSIMTDGIDGSVVVAFRIDPQTWARLSRKMGPQDPATFLWENILHRAVEGAAY
jgi:hypothetical protein